LEESDAAIACAAQNGLLPEPAVERLLQELDAWLSYGFATSNPPPHGLLQ